MNGFLTWLFSQAGAGWVFGIVSLLTLVISILYRRKGRHVVFQELETTSLISIRKEIRDRIKVSYDGREIHSLGFIQGELFNPGSDVIKNCHITLSLPQSAHIIDIVAISSLDDCTIATTVQDRIATVAIPFLNSYHGHSHTVIVAMTYDGNHDDLAIVGSGEGWSLKRIGVLSSALWWKLLFPFLGIITTFIIFNSWYISWIEKNYGISANEFSSRAFVASLPILFFITLFVIWLAIVLIRSTKARTPKTTLSKIKSV